MRFVDPDGMWPDLPASVMNSLRKFNEEASKVFSGSANIEAKYWGLGGGVKVAGAKFKGEVNIAEGTAKIDNKGTLKLEGRAANIKAEAGFGKTKETASVDIVKGTVDISITSNDQIKSSLKAADYELKGERGPITVSDASELSISGKVGPVEVFGSLHLDNLFNAASSLIEAGGNYISEKINDAMRPMSKVSTSVNSNSKIR
jgi:hypothetical protein